MGKDKEVGAINTSCYVQVLGVGSDTGCTVPSVLLFFDRQRYLFNVGEGFQRFCVEHRVKLTKTTGVMVTRVTTEATGGLPGMLLTMADSTAGGLLTGHVGMTVHGPPGLQTLVNAFRTFVNVRDMGLKVMEFGKKEGAGIAARPIIKNEAVAITPVIVLPSGASAGAGEEPSAKRQKTAGDDATGPFGNSIEVASTAVESAAACYVCELPDIPGKFLPQKAASLGVPRGPLYGQLTKGFEVTGANGRTVRPADVMQPSTPGPVVLVVDCPSEAFIAGLADPTNGIGRWAADEETRKKVACVVHLCTREVLDLPSYRAFIASFGEGPQHVLVAESQGSRVPIMKKCSVLQVKLNALDQQMFAMPPEAAAATEEKTAADRPPLPQGCVEGRNMLRYFLRPVAKTGFDDEECGTELDAAAVVEELRLERPQALEEAGKVEAAGAAAAALPNVPPAVAQASDDEFSVTFLGTGAAIPSKYRNVTGLLFDMAGRGAAMLADCGEGSLGQMRRRLGTAGCDDVLRRLAMVWISHVHADHHVGLPALLAARTRLLGPDCAPLVVVGPRPLRRALSAYAQLEPMRFRFIEAAMTEKKPESADTEFGGAEGPTVPADVQAALAEARATLGLARLDSIRVVHCAHSFGLVIESDGSRCPPWKVVFSGDTRPCDALVEAAKGATLLIHEATFDDTMAEEAVAKKHCTTSEAVASGAAAGAYRTLLTHFSQRYPKVPLIDENFVDHVGIAFDLMTVRLTDLPRLPALVPAAKALFGEEEEGGEEPEPEPAMHE